MKLSKLDLGAWFRALGADSPTPDPQVFETIQPVIIVSDHRDLVPQARIGQGILGAMQAQDNGIGVRLPVYFLRPGTPGGCVVHRWWYSYDHSDSGTDDWEGVIFGLRVEPTTSFVVALSEALVNSFDERFPLQARLVHGVRSVASLSSTQDPQILVQVNSPQIPTGSNVVGGPAVVDGPFYVPPGLVMIWQCGQRAVSLDRTYLTVLVSDIPARRLP